MLKAEELKLILTPSFEYAGSQIKYNFIALGLCYSHFISIFTQGPVMFTVTSKHFQK